MDEKAREILTFWFGPSDDPLERSETWWQKDEAFDHTIEERFGAWVEKAAEGQLEEWKKTARGRLAYIILLDQFSRNIYRDTPQAFAQDEQALSACLEGCTLGQDQQLEIIERAFFYMPMMHSEQLEIQDRAVALFEELTEEAEGELEEYMKGSLDFADRHREIIERFGRFPHRNDILGRETTTEEAEFLEQPGSSF